MKVQASKLMGFSEPLEGPSRPVTYSFSVKWIKKDHFYELLYILKLKQGLQDDFVYKVKHMQ